jgi:hypothetical protein
MNIATKPPKRLKSSDARPSIHIASQSAAEVKKASGPVLLKSGGRTTGVALNLKSYRHMVAEIERLETLVGIARGLEDVRQGRTRPWAEVKVELERKFGLSRRNIRRGRS